MRRVETSAKTREEAIAAALKQLGAERHEVHVEIVEQGSAGFLGFGARKWLVRVTLEGEDDDEHPVPVHETAPRREERGAPRARDRRPDRGGQNPANDRQRTSPQQPREPRAPQKGAPERKDSQKGDRLPQKARQERERKDQPAAAPREKAERKEQPPREPREPRKEQEPRPPRPPRQELAPITEDRALEATALLETVLNKMGFEATITSKLTEDGGLRLNVESPDSALLIGRKGQSLSSLQYLINRMVHTGEGEGTERIIIDVEGYLDRRNSALEEMALELSARAKETRKRVRVRPLSPEERRVVHLTLEKDDEVRTFSVGNSPIRSIIIVPKNEIEPPPRRQDQAERRPETAGVAQPAADRVDRGGRPRQSRGGRNRSRGGRGPRPAQNPAPDESQPNEGSGE